jgi:hypothetical protein
LHRRTPTLFQAGQAFVGRLGHFHTDSVVAQRVHLAGFWLLVRPTFLFRAAGWIPLEITNTRPEW